MKRSFTDFIKEIKAKADANSDGKITKEDLDALKEKFPDYKEKIDKLITKTDINDDGKVDLEDAKKLFNDNKGFFNKK